MRGRVFAAHDSFECLCGGGQDARRDRGPLPGACRYLRWFAQSVPDLGEGCRFSIRPGADLRWPGKRKKRFSTPEAPAGPPGRAAARAFCNSLWLGSIQRLNLALFIDRQHDGMVGRIDVHANDLLELGGKLRIGGQLKLAHQMRPQAVSAPYPLHRTDADPRRFGQGRASPVARCRRRQRRMTNAVFQNLCPSRPDCIDLTKVAVAGR
jgi:hypothetical protein